MKLESYSLKHGKLKKSISNNVSSPEADYIIETAIKNGANGGKVIGAGNGGFILLQVPKNIKKYLRFLQNF